ncbi:hypothetical protein J3R82DRAFT_10212 [Butyriboletus roseoflavus]|nr:hypothetical protein J3R82DRAFT_10212 [Butyriboletus roseoflavus]
MTVAAAPVLVAGGGPSGLVVALTLLQNRIPVRIIDKEPHHRIGQRGHGLWPRTFEVFHFLRAHEIHQRATPVLPIQEYKPGTLEPTKTFSMFTHNDPTPSIPYNNPMFLGQPPLEELQSFEDNGERVLAKLVKRKDGEETCEVFEASYLIGADGARGLTRKELGLTFLGETRQDFSSVVGDICLEMEGIDRKHWHFLGSRSSNFLMFRPTDEIAPDGFQFLMSMKDYNPKQLIADEKLMFKCMSELIGHEIRVRKVVVLSEFRPNIRVVDKFGGGRVFIVGDSAHVHSPTGGQGLNTCVQDALNLAWKLSLAHKGLSPATLLDSYTKERLPIVAEMLNITSGILQQIREAPTIDRAMEREKRMNMLGVNCRTSPIVLDEFTHAEPVNAYGVLDEGVLVAGDRAPDAPGLVVAASSAETKLFDVFSPTYHTVLVFAPDAATSVDILEALRRYHGDVIRPVIVLPQGSEVTTVAQADIVVDHSGHAYRGYLAVKGEKKVVVVRPDGVVGAIVRGVEGVGAYFVKIFV